MATSKVNLVQANVYRPYSRAEIHTAARKAGIDPVWLEALYSVESSDGRDPNAMGVQQVQRKRDKTLVRGPFQLEDDTVSDYLRRNKMPANTDISDHDTYLAVAAGIAADKHRQAGGDYDGATDRYFGIGTDQFGTTTSQYRQRVMNAMDRINGGGGATYEGQATAVPDAPEETMQSGGTDAFGMPSDMGTMSMKDFLASARDSGGGDMGTMSWKDFLSSARGPTESPHPVAGLGIPAEMGGDMPMAEAPAQEGLDQDSYIASIVNEQMSDRDYNNAAAA